MTPIRTQRTAVLLSPMSLREADINVDPNLQPGRCRETDSAAAAPATRPVAHRRSIGERPRTESVRYEPDGARLGPTGVFRLPGGRLRLRLRLRPHRDHLRELGTQPRGRAGPGPGDDPDHRQRRYGIHPDPHRAGTLHRTRRDVPVRG